MFTPEPTELLTLLAALRPPDDYYTGILPALGAGPTHVQVFHRTASLEAESPSIHHRYLIVICLQGAGAVVLDGTTHMLQPGTGLLVFPFQSHHFSRMARSMKWLFIGFEMPPSEHLTLMRDRIFRCDQNSQQHLHHILTGYVAWRAGHIQDALGVTAHLTLLLLECKRRLIRARTGKQTGTPGGLSRNLQHVNDLARYVSSRLDSNIRLQDLTHALHVSAPTLRRAIMGGIGIPPARFIRSLRVHRACGLLAVSTASISEISDQCGFTSPFIFSRTFKHVTGYSPRDYRKRHRTKNLLA